MTPFASWLLALSVGGLLAAAVRLLTLTDDHRADDLLPTVDPDRWHLPYPAPVEVSIVEALELVSHDDCACPTCLDVAWLRAFSDECAALFSRRQQ